jgi:hypothetical protein
MAPAAVAAAPIDDDDDDPKADGDGDPMSDIGLTEDGWPSQYPAGGVGLDATVQHTMKLSVCFTSGGAR